MKSKILSEKKPAGKTDPHKKVSDEQYANDIYKELFRTSEDGMMILDAETGRIMDVNQGLAGMLHCSREEFLQKTVPDIFFLGIVSDYRTAIEELRNQKYICHRSVPFRTRDGVSLNVTFNCHIFNSGRKEYVQCGIREITDQSKTQNALRESEERYRTIVENSQEGIFQTSSDNRRMTFNPAFAVMLGYTSSEEAEVGITDFAGQVYVNPEEYGKMLDIILTEGGVKGYETEFYRRDKSRIWVNMSISGVKDHQGALLYYHGIVEDITPKKKLEQERQESINRLRKSLGATINAMSATVEARDPYTAGHQRRVSDLARTIATEMQLSRDQIDGIRLAGMIHDLGKISVPSEILTKPTRLTDLEFELIKTHSEAGYNILKDIEFPWPIARIVLEHHERIDGSGYPQGLKGEDILLESKIIAVADVVEAISSHRPYRPAFGLGPALDEIAQNSGTIYDAAVAEACLNLFREHRYKMPE